MRQILLLVMATILIMGYGMQNAGYEIPEEIIIVKGPSKEPHNPYQEEYEKLLYPTVRISAGFSTGSGVIIDDYILTAAHVVGDESEVTIEFYPDVSTSCLRAFVAITDTVKDLALLRVKSDSLFKAALAPRNYTPYIFTPVYTVGCSLGLNPRPSQGIISVIEKDHWEIASPILPGNSGGPVYDARTYQVIGIAVWVKTYQGQLVTTMAGIVTIQDIHAFLAQANK
ncbi:MAG: serine protease [Planctomycetota bacterium]